MKVSDSIEISAPPEEIWPYLVEPDKTKQWFTVLQEFDYIDTRPEGVGTTFHWKERSGKREFDLYFETTEWEPNRVFGFRMTSGDFLKSYNERWAIEPRNGGSVFSFSDKIELPWGPFGKFIGAFAKKQSAKDGKEVMANLKRIVEGDQ